MEACLYYTSSLRSSIVAEHRVVAAYSSFAAFCVQLAARRSMPVAYVLDVSRQLFLEFSNYQVFYFRSEFPQEGFFANCLVGHIRAVLE